MSQWLKLIHGTVASKTNINTLENYTILPAKTSSSHVVSRYIIIYYSHINSNAAVYVSMFEFIPLIFVFVGKWASYFEIIIMIILCKSQLIIQ